MALRSTRSLISAAAVAAAALTLSACGGGDADVANGKEKFKASCGSCHTLADAGTAGNVGPNLDDAFRGPRAEGFKASTFRGVVRRWIDTPEQISQPVMPADILTGQDADDVAEYVAAYAGLDPEAPARPAEPLPAEPKN